MSTCVGCGEGLESDDVTVLKCSERDSDRQNMKPLIGVTNLKRVSSKFPLEFNGI